jgi:hypothetical protein
LGLVTAQVPPEDGLMTAWSRDLGLVAKLVLIGALAAAVVVVTAEPGGERRSLAPAEVTVNGTVTAGEPQVLGVQEERPAPSTPGSGDLVALPGGGGLSSDSVSRVWAIGLSLLLLGLAGLGLVAASKPEPA